MIPAFYANQHFSVNLGGVSVAVINLLTTQRDFLLRQSSVALISFMFRLGGWLLSYLGSALVLGSTLHIYCYLPLFAKLAGNIFFFYQTRFRTRKIWISEFFSLISPKTHSHVCVKGLLTC